MKSVKTIYLKLFLLLYFAVSLITIFPGTALSHQSITTNKIIYLDDCAADNFAPQSKTAYVGNSYTRIFHHASCQYTRLIAEKRRVYFDTRLEAVKSKYVPCSACKP